MGLPDIENIPDTGAVFTIGRSRFADNVASHFFIRKDPVVTITCGDEHSAVVCQSGRLFVFGSNDWGQLGLGHKNHVSKPSCVKILKPEKVTHVACGRAHTLICTGGQKVFACGSDQEGQLGRGSSAIGDSSSSPVLVYDCGLAGPRIVQVAAGSHHSMALTSDGGVVAWGSNLEGQLGLSGISGLVNKPTKVPLPEPVKQISTGYYHSAFLTENGLVYICGESESGKLGIDVNFSSQVAPRRVQLSSPARHVACGGHHTFILAEDGNLYCAGSNASGQLGMGSNVTEVQTPKLLPRGAIRDETVVKIACGESHTAVVTDTGKLFTCGDGRHGKLGLEENENNVHEFTYADKYQELFVSNVSCGGCHTILVGRRRETNKQNDTESIQADNLIQKKNPLPPLKLPVNRLQGETRAEKPDDTEKADLDNEKSKPSTPPGDGTKEEPAENEDPAKDSMNNIEEPLTRVESASSRDRLAENSNSSTDAKPTETEGANVDKKNPEDSTNNNTESSARTDAENNTEQATEEDSKANANSVEAERAEEVAREHSDSKTGGTSPEKKNVSPDRTPPPKPPRQKTGSAESSKGSEEGARSSRVRSMENEEERGSKNERNEEERGAGEPQDGAQEGRETVAEVNDSPRKDDAQEASRSAEGNANASTNGRRSRSAKSKIETEETIEVDTRTAEHDGGEDDGDGKRAQTDNVAGSVTDKVTDNPADNVADDADVVQSPAPRTGKVAKLFKAKRQQEMENGTKTAGAVNPKPKSKTCTVL